MVRCAHKNQFCVTEGHLEDVCHTDMWLQSQTYQRRAEKESQCQSGNKKDAVTPYSVIKERGIFFIVKRNTLISTLLNRKTREIFKLENKIRVKTMLKLKL